MDPKIPDPCELRPLTGSLIPITMVPLTIDASGTFILEIEPRIIVLGGVIILTVTAMTQDTVDKCLSGLSIAGVDQVLEAKIAQSFKVDIQGGTVIVKGKVLEGQMVSFSAVGSGGQTTITIRGRA